jgi:hypothetical protein
MKTLAFLFKAVSVILIAVMFPGCEIPQTGVCDLTIAPEKSVSITAIVHIRGKNNLPMKDQRIKVEIFKKPCGAPEKGNIIFEGTTDADGNFSTTVANYNLRNKEDKVSVDAYGADIVVGGISERNFEVLNFMYDDFVAGTIKNVDITLLTNQ